MMHLRRGSSRGSDRIRRELDWSPTSVSLSRRPVAVCPLTSMSCPSPAVREVAECGLRDWEKTCSVGLPSPENSGLHHHWCEWYTGRLPLSVRSDSLGVNHVTKKLHGGLGKCAFLSIQSHSQVTESLQYCLQSLVVLLPCRPVNEYVVHHADRSS